MAMGFSVYLQKVNPCFLGIGMANEISWFLHCEHIAALPNSVFCFTKFPILGIYVPHIKDN